MPKKLLLNNSFVSDFDSELTRQETGPARRFARQFLAARVFVSVVTVEEFYEERGRDAAPVLALRFSVLGIQVADAR